MNKVVGVYQTGSQSAVIDGAAVVYDNIYISYITDEIPDNLVEGYSGCRAIEEKIRRNDVKLVGLQTDDWSQLIGCEIDFGYVKDLKGKLKINKVLVQGTSIDDKNKTKKES